MTGFKTLTSIAVPLIRDNVDTDAIIPSREMTSVSKIGLAEGLFAGWRYMEGRTPNPDFVLNQPGYAGAQILLGGANFGCGSSREHAIWALAEYGFRVIVAFSFNPIFRANCVRNGIVPVELDATPLAQAQGRLTVDLPNQSVTATDGRRWTFAIDVEAKAMLLDGLDEIGLTLLQAGAITAFRAHDRTLRPWAYL
ncbi:3-isopropylmalate dehydratase small subunit [Sphingobium sp.]|uniref:3-isopropylmalate dehydratase small subunit n=1 Tax=Sphingobium sp. TaxID=1912891 RepID=UPI002CC39A47|nr:3-isopropylmalate dehydratase small subunit [Sphingobium sp.]HUD95525.1 3-isopropylmalate dehydratase small subunit [Sphingobium sp.]